MKAFIMRPRLYSRFTKSICALIAPLLIGLSAYGDVWFEGTGDWSGTIYSCEGPEVVAYSDCECGISYASMSDENGVLDDWYYPGDPAYFDLSGYGPGIYFVYAEAS